MQTEPFTHNCRYGRSVGRRILKADLNAPTSISRVHPGIGPFPDSTFSTFKTIPARTKGTYSITFEHLRLIGAPAPAVTSYSFDPITRELALTWSSRPGRLYSILYSSGLTDEFNPVSTDLEPDGPGLLRQCPSGRRFGLGKNPGAISGFLRSRKYSIGINRSSSGNPPSNNKFSRILPFQFHARDSQHRGENRVVDQSAAAGPNRGRPKNGGREDSNPGWVAPIS